MAREQKFIIFRQDNETTKPRYERYSVPLTSGMTILEALFYIQDHFDSTLAFRYSCRGAICGSCGMTIDKYPRLACKTQIAAIKDIRIPKLPEIVFGEILDWDKDTEILIEPLPNMKVLKDLIVDMEPFWKFYREVKPYFVGEWKDIAPESLQSPKEAQSIEHLIYCILCGLCWTCPVSGKNKDYLGPAALAKGFRFIADTRVPRAHGEKILERVKLEDGVPACEKIFACNRVCPKGVRPGTAIKLTRDILEG
ncbi:MAG: succinate dehydrogenase/fumarate reductase iron-sulfur subunit [Promethearchaeota archaeon]